MTITIRRLSASEFALLTPELVDIYIKAMGYSPRIRDNRVHAWRREVYQPGFQAVIAEDSERILGCAYGFYGTPDTWWDRQLRRAFEREGGPTTDQLEMLHSYFELAEIHVHPSAQGHGIGRNLLTALLENVPMRYCLLSTPEVAQEANYAFWLYRSLGFEDVLRHFLYPGDDRRFAVLGATLPLSA